MKNKFIVGDAMILIDYLVEVLKKPRKKAKVLLTNKSVYVNGEPTSKYNFPLFKGNIVEVKEFDQSKIDSRIEIIYEDKDIIVVNKAAGILTISTEKEKEKTLYHMVSDYVKIKNKNARIFVIHRLDKETSGIVMFAKNETIKAEYQDNWDKLVLYRGYTAVCEGVLRAKNMRMIQYLEEGKNMKMYSTTKDRGKEAITNYKVLKSNGRYSLVDINIETGRKNQIRVCMHDLKCPIVGDAKYGSNSKVLKRMALVANKLTVLNTKTKDKMEFQIPVPTSFINIVK